MISSIASDIIISHLGAHYDDELYKESESRFHSRKSSMHTMTSSSGNVFRVTGHLCGWIPAQSPVAQSFDIFFDLLWINGLVNTVEACDLRRHRAHYDATLINFTFTVGLNKCMATDTLAFKP